MKRILPVMLALMLVLTCTAMADATNVNLTGMPIVNEKIEMDMMISYDTARGVDPNENAVWQYLEELTNIKWNFGIVDSTAWSEQLSLLWASNDLPDMIYNGVSMSDIGTYTGRQIMDISGYLETYAPNISALIETSRNVELAMVQSNGAVGSFIWTNMDVEVGSGQCPPEILYINQEWLDALKLEMPQTVEEYRAALIAFRDGDPNGNGVADEIALAPRHASKNLNFLQPLMGFMSNGSGLYLKDDQVIYTPFMDEYKLWVEFCRDLYAEGLLDPEVFTMNNSQVLAKGSTETQIYGSIIASAAFTVVGANNADAFVPTPVYIAANGEQMWYTRVFANPGVGIITSACAYPEAAVRWCDLFYDAEYQKLVWMGVEGQAYEYYEDGTTWNWIYSDEYPDTTAVRASLTIQGGGQGPSICPVDWFNLDDATEGPVNEQRKQIGSDYFGKLRVAMPALYYDSNAQREINAITTDLTSYIDQQFALFVTGEADIDAGWEEFTATLRAMGAETLVELTQQTYDGVK